MRISDWSSDVCSSDLHADDERGYGSGLHRDGEALDDVGAVARGRGLGDALYRPVLRARVVLGHPDQQPCDDEADDRAEEQRKAGERSDERAKGKSVRGRVDLGVRRGIKKKKKS